MTLSSSHGDFESLALAELKPGVFVGDIQLSPDQSSISNGELEVAEQGTIEVHYEDVDFLDGASRSIKASAVIFGDDHGDHAANSTRMTLNSVVGGELELPGDVDSFAIDLSAGVSYEISTTLTGLDDTVLTVRNSAGVIVAENDDAGGLTASKIRWEPYTTGTYYVEVAGYSDSTGDYHLGVLEANGNDDHRNGPLNATVLSGGSIEGNIETDIDRDWFQFDAISGVEYSIEVHTIGLVDSYLRLLDSDGVTLIELSDDIPNGLSSRIDWQPPRTDRFFVEVTGWAGDRGSYELTLSSLIPPDPFESNDLQFDATILSGQTPMENLSIHDPVDVDWYQWIAMDSGLHTFYTESVGGHLAVQLFSASGALLGAATAQQSSTISITITASANQQIFVKAEGTGDNVVVPQYSMVIEHGPRLVGDLNNDRIANIADVDLLCSSIRDSNSDIAFDLNHDGMIDALDLDFMLEDVLDTVFGDVTLDKQFDSSDFVAVFALRQYEDEIPGNSVWSSGDWNCDGDFDSKDLINAFSRATYSRDGLAVHLAALGELWRRRDEDLGRLL